MYWNLIWKSPEFVQFWVQSDPIWRQTYHPCLMFRSISVGSKVGQIRPQIGQIRDFFRSDFSTFGSMSQIYWNLIWKGPGFVQFGVQSNLTHFGAKPTIPGRASRTKDPPHGGNCLLLAMFYLLLYPGALTFQVEINKYLDWYAKIWTKKGRGV